MPIPANARAWSGSLQSSGGDPGGRPAGAVSEPRFPRALGRWCILWALDRTREHVVVACRAMSGVDQCGYQQLLLLHRRKDFPQGPALANRSQNFIL